MARNLRKLKSKVLDVQMAGWLSGTFARVALPVLLCSAFSISSTQAALSGETGTIVGRAPTVTGNLLITGPDGDVLNEAMLDAESTPNSYSVSADMSELILNDVDGDSGLTAELSLPKPALVWKDGTRTLPSTELNQTFNQAARLGKLLTVTVSPSVKVSTTTGMPRIATTVLPQTYRFFPQGSLFELSANGTRFPSDSGFPTTGFLGAYYTPLVNGNYANNINYTWTTSQPDWMTLDLQGRITFTNKPTLAQKTYTITATPKAGGSPPITFTTTLKSWFSKPTTRSYYWKNASEMCNGISAKSRLPLVSELTPAPKFPLGTYSPRGIGSLWGEWGIMSETYLYKGSGFGNGLYWSSEADGSDGHYAAAMDVGVVLIDTGASATCIEPL